MDLASSLKLIITFFLLCWDTFASILCFDWHNSIYKVYSHSQHFFLSLSQWFPFWCTHHHFSTTRPVFSVTPLYLLIQTFPTNRTSHLSRLTHWPPFPNLIPSDWVRFLSSINKFSNLLEIFLQKSNPAFCLRKLVCEWEIWNSHRLTEIRTTIKSWPLLYQVSRGFNTLNFTRWLWKGDLVTIDLLASLFKGKEKHDVKRNWKGVLVS